MQATLYIFGKRVSQFADEKIEMNNSVKNISDISKVFADFSQGFSLPADHVNNPIFEYWYDDDVDGSFNWNLRADAYLEIDTLPGKYGSIQLDGVKMKSGKPSSYNVTFYSNIVNLSDLFGDDDLSALDLSEFDHVYNEANVVSAMRLPSIANGDIYYPLINAVAEMSIGGPYPERDLYNDENTIHYQEFKPALRDIRIIEAIEARYGITFSRDFFDRSLFMQKFTWLHREAGYMKSYGSPVVLNITSTGSIASAGGTVSTSNDTISYNFQGVGGDGDKRFWIRVAPAAGFEEVIYKVHIFNNGQEVASVEGIGIQTVVYEDGAANVVQGKISASAYFECGWSMRLFHTNPNDFPPIPDIGSTNGTQTFDNAMVLVSNHIPTIKVKEYINSLISQFNLILRPLSKTSFYVDTLNNWYSKGRVWDITKYVDDKERPIRRPDVKKRIEFLYAESGSLLALRYRKNNQVGYGDLKAVYNVNGTELKIESVFENMLFERLPNETTGELTDLQAGYALDESLEPYVGKPFSFFRNGYTDVESGEAIYIQPSPIALTRIWQTATENNLKANQVTASLNFGADISSYLYTPINQSLYANFWQTFIEELFDKKTRVRDEIVHLPLGILYKLQLNDRLRIRDKKFKISATKIDVTTGRSGLEIFSDLGPPLDSENSIDPLTVDSTEYTADSTILTVDMVSIHRPDTSYTVNGISLEAYLATASEEDFEVAISANTIWTAAAVSLGYGTSWLSINKTTGTKSDYVRIRVNRNTGSYRKAIMRFIIDGANFDVTIQQTQ